MSNERTLTGLQFLRGLCALAVVVDHSAGMASLPKYFGRSFLGGALDYGAFGVDIFFVISAFIISIVVLRREQKPTTAAGGLWQGVVPSLSASKFLRKRFIRIVPLMWLAILSYATLQVAFVRSAIDVAAYLRALLLVPYSFVKPDMIWTLRHEFLFYTAFALSFLVSKRLRLVLPLFLLSPIVYCLFWNGITLPTGGIDSIASIVFGAVHIEFGAGLILGLFWVHHSPTVNIRMPLHPYWILSFLTVSVMAAGALLPWLPQSLPSTGLMGLLGAALIALSARVVCPTGLLTAFGELVGNASYAIYLFHLHALASVLAIWAKLFPNSPLAVVVPTVVLVATGVGIATHLFVERPLVAWTRNRLSHSPVQLPSPR